MTRRCKQTWQWSPFLVAALTAARAKPMAEELQVSA
eukprot:CAMPEP_0174316924 /NCGR_PEP_ID=MMETSP0810-20121108/7280_1 /TAXON_ID=73025 ORGANISM="Eutreptiella gymnastica-like, Strain CCMP1594" /NCGR_SAMPLE_ID=MMETSP0810 /ASSEMBLY_ACC=CAM_ASM_000659 /LENGTH=35 /DNA_ID= /DNA_START= /DNA_END= /DNA_ORIENTATION=